MKFVYALISLIVLYLFYGFIISKIDLKPQPTTSTIQFDQNKIFNDYKGVINVHSIQGAGQGSVPEIVKAAYLAKLDFLIFTESLVYSKPLERPSYAGDLLILHGREYSYLKSRLILLDNEYDFSQITNAANAQLYISDILENPSHAFIILNHPTKSGYEWEGDHPPNLDALEIVNLRSNWSQAWQTSKLNFIRSLLIYPFNADYAFINLYQYPVSNLRLWNQLSKKNPTVGLLGTDAKSKLRIYSNKYLRFPSYKKLFSLGSNHILIRSELTGNTASDSVKVLEAIKNGSLYLSLDFVGDPLGFQFYAKAKEGQIYPMGSTIEAASGLELCVHSPHLSEGVSGNVYLDGQLFVKLKNKTRCFKASQSGSYNVIMTKKVKRIWPLNELVIPWIISNFIYIHSPSN